MGNAFLAGQGGGGMSDKKLDEYLTGGSIEYNTPGDYTWICPKGVRYVYVIAWGGFGGGGGGGGGRKYTPWGGYNTAGTGGGGGSAPDAIMAMIAVTPKINIQYYCRCWRKRWSRRCWNNLICKRRQRGIRWR